MPCVKIISRGNPISLRNTTGVGVSLHRMMRQAIFAAVIVLPATYAEANAGTPLMWAGSLYLLVGNAVIGLLEAMVLIFVFKTKQVQTCVLLVLANYLSAWSGAYLLDNGISLVIADVDLNSLSALFWTSILVTYLVTLLLEFPFVVATLKGKPERITKAIGATLVVQTLSYTLLTFGCLGVTNTSLYTQVQIVEPGQIQLSDQFILYYIADTDGYVYRRSLSSGDEVRISDLQSQSPNDRLLVLPSEGEGMRHDLYMRLESEPYRNAEVISILKSMEVTAAVSSSDDDPMDDENTIYGNWFNFGPAPKLGEAESSQWSFRTGFWWGEGLSGHNEKTGRRVRIGMESPFARWAARNAIHLPGDLILLQFGENQICLFDPENEQIALMVKGRGPVVVIADPLDHEALD